MSLLRTVRNSLSFSKTLSRSGAQRGVVTTTTLDPKKDYSELNKEEVLQGAAKKTYKLDRVDRFVMEQFGKYEKGQVPDMVEEREIAHAKDKFRIYASNYSIILTLFLAYLAVQYGKNYKERGEKTVCNQNKDKHRKWRQEQIELEAKIDEISKTYK